MKKISVEELSLNPMTLIANEWMLITAGDEKGYNTMTASWGHLGSIWGSTLSVCPPLYAMYVPRDTQSSLSTARRFTHSPSSPRNFTISSCTSAATQAATRTR